MFKSSNKIYITREKKHSLLCYLPVCSFHCSFFLPDVPGLLILSFPLCLKNNFWLVFQSRSASNKIIIFLLSENVYFLFTPEGSFHQIWNPWLTFVFLQNLKNTVTLYIGLHDFRREILGLLNCCSPIASVISFCLLSRYFFGPEFSKFNYSVSLHGFILSLSCLEFAQFPGCMSFTIFWKFQPLFLQIFFYLHILLTLFLRLQWCKYWIFCYCPIGSWGFVHVFSVYVFSVAQPEWILLFSPQVH